MNSKNMGMDIIKFFAGLVFSIVSAVFGAYMFIRVEIAELKVEVKEMKEMQEKMFDKLFNERK